MAKIQHFSPAITGSNSIYGAKFKKSTMGSSDPDAGGVTGLRARKAPVRIRSASATSSAVRL